MYIYIYIYMYIYIYTYMFVAKQKHTWLCIIIHITYITCKQQSDFWSIWTWGFHAAQVVDHRRGCSCARSPSSGRSLSNVLAVEKCSHRDDFIGMSVPRVIDLEAAYDPTKIIRHIDDFRKALFWRFRRVWRWEPVVSQCDLPVSVARMWIPGCAPPWIIQALVGVSPHALGKFDHDLNDYDRNP